MNKTTGDVATAASIAVFVASLSARDCERRIGRADRCGETFASNLVDLNSVFMVLGECVQRSKFCECTMTECSGRTSDERGRSSMAEQWNMLSI